MRHRRIKIKNSLGLDLNSTLDEPVGSEIRAYAVFAHCFTCTGSLKAVRNISRELVAQGIAVLRFDFTGLGLSQGEFKQSNITNNIRDIIYVSDFLAENYQAPKILIGHSLGGAAVLLSAGQIDSVSAVATIGAPSDVQHVKHLFHEENQDIWQVNIGGRPFEISKDFVEQLSRVDLISEVKKLKKPLLVLHSPFDKTVSIDHARNIFKEAFHPKSFVSLDTADHLLSKKQDGIYVSKVIAGWVDRYIPSSEKKELNPDSEQLIGHLDLVHDKFTTSIATSNHHFIADEPLSIGGDDIGPSPYDLLSASIAACKLMTIRMYVQRKNWPLEEAYIKVSYSKVKREDLETNKAVDHMDISLQLIGDELDEKQRLRIKEIADKCPVHRTLQSEMHFNTRLID